MNKLTFCPHFIMDIPSTASPEQVEKFYVKPLKDLIKESKSYNLELCVSKAIVEKFETTFPWDRSFDGAWKGYVNDWHTIIKDALNQSDWTVHPVQSSTSQFKRCNALSSNVNDIFESFLNFIGTKTLHNKESEEAVYIQNNLCSKYTNFIQIDNLDNIKIAEFTWFKIYPDNLPHIGEIPFVPPVKWKKSNLPKRESCKENGYLDSVGRAWRWDKKHKDHWDVQDKKQGTDKYTNVTPEGVILRKDH